MSRFDVILSRFDVKFLRQALKGASLRKASEEELLAALEVAVCTVAAMTVADRQVAAPAMASMGRVRTVVHTAAAMQEVAGTVVVRPAVAAAEAVHVVAVAV